MVKAKRHGCVLAHAHAHAQAQVEVTRRNRHLPNDCINVSSRSQRQRCRDEYSLTSRECILRESTFGTIVKVEADESPAVGDTRLLCEAAAAMGTEKADRARGDALLKAEANTLAACAEIACRDAWVLRLCLGVFYKLCCGGTGEPM